MGWFATETDCDRRLREENKRLQAEIDDRRYEEERRQEQREREREAARREQREIRAEEMRTARDWPDAFRKGYGLFSSEAASEARDNAHFAAHVAEHPEDANDPLWQPTTYFLDMPDKIRRAEAIYHEEMERIEEQIAALNAGALAAVAARVEAEIGERELAQALRADTPDYLTNW